MKKEIIVKKSGFSYLELIYCLFMFINLFVLCSQIFYNININHKIIEEKRVLSYETIVLRIETHLKEVSVYEVGDDYFFYYYRNHLYYYALVNEHLRLKIDSTSYNLIDQINKISFHLNHYFLEITITDNFNCTYHTKVIIYD